MFSYFKDRITQYKNKYNVTINGETTSAEISKDNGIVSQEGTPLNAYNLNNSFMEFAKYLFPVGSVYITRENINPSTFIENTTWQRCCMGKTVAGVGTYKDKNGDSMTLEVGYTYGEFKHTLTVEEMPSHSHPQVVTANTDGSGIRRDYYSDGSCKIYAQGCNTLNTGGSKAHNNMQPTTPLYFWYRVS